MNSTINEKIQPKGMISDDLKNKVNDIKNYLTEIYASLGKEEEDSELILWIRSELKYPLSLTLKFLVPDIHQKINEIIYSHERNLSVLSQQHGADLQDVDGNCHEHKTSIWKKGGKCNFNWPIPPRKKDDIDDEKRRKKLIESVKSKTKGGTAIFEIKDYHQNLLYSFVFRHAFIVEYFNRVPLGGSNVYNFGCDRCRYCNKFHRLERLKSYEVKFIKDSMLSETDWDLITESPCKTHCGSEDVKQHEKKTKEKIH